MRLIDADAIKIPKGFFEKVDNVPKFYDWLNEQPTIDPVKHGKWIKKYRGHFSCSVCGAWYKTTDEYGNIIDGDDEMKSNNYCSNCGARMVD